MSTQPQALGAATIPSMVGEYGTFYNVQNSNAIAVADSAVKSWEAAALITQAQKLPTAPFPQMPVLVHFDQDKALTIAYAWNQEIMNGDYTAKLDFSPAITTSIYSPTVAIPGQVAATPPNPTNPVGPEEGLGSGIYSVVDGNTRANGTIFYLFGVPLRLNVIPSPFGTVQFYKIDWTAAKPPTPTFTGDAPTS